ncbi:MAG: hypothetical protein AAB463_01160 [Patescibacteria group bacterium]
MIYLILLVGALVGIFSLSLGQLPFPDQISSLRSQLIEAIIPKTQNEILIENLTPHQEALRTFFTEQAPLLLNSKNISAAERTTLQQAVEQFNNSDTVIQSLSESISERSPTQILLDRFSSSSPEQPSPTTSASPSATALPQASTSPNCEVICK